MGLSYLQDLSRLSVLIDDFIQLLGDLVQIGDRRVDAAQGIRITARDRADLLDAGAQLLHRARGTIDAFGGLAAAMAGLLQVTGNLTGSGSLLRDLLADLLNGAGNRGDDAVDLTDRTFRLARDLLHVADAHDERPL